MSGTEVSGTSAVVHTADTPQLLLEHHLKELRLPTILREYDKVARQCAVERLLASTRSCRAERRWSGRFSGAWLNWKRKSYNAQAHLEKTFG